MVRSERAPEYRQGYTWVEWVDNYQSQLTQTGLPPQTFQSPDRWWGFLEGDAYYVSQLTARQRQALNRLLIATLSEPERLWGKAVWFALHPIQIFGGVLYKPPSLIPGRIIAMLTPYDVSVQVNPHWRNVAHPDVSLDAPIWHINSDKIPFELRAPNTDIWLVFPPVIKYAGAISSMCAIGRYDFEYPNLCPYFTDNPELCTELLQKVRIRQPKQPWWQFW